MTSGFKGYRVKVKCISFSVKGENESP